MSRDITPNELKRFFPRATESTRRSNKATEAGPQPAVRDQPVHQEESPEPEHLVQDESVGSGKGKTGHSVGHLRRNSDEDRPTVRFCYTLYLTRPLDPEDIITKFFTDGFIYAEFIFNDRSKDIEVWIEQVQVDTLKEEGTGVTITPI